MTAEDVLRFWFEESSPKQWFVKDESFDAKIRERFLDTYRAAREGKTKSWRDTSEGRLAEIIVLDQFPRNVFRGKPESFASDALALQLAQEAVSTGDDTKLPKARRHFLYMPYMHSESREMHREALWLFASLLPSGWNSFIYEWKHKRIIDRFGRYPHRNAILNRASTPAEEEFLKTHQGF